VGVVGHLCHQTIQQVAQAVRAVGFMEPAQEPLALPLVQIQMLVERHHWHLRLLAQAAVVVQPLSVGMEVEAPAATAVLV